jgi:hypothetical protein
VQPDGGVTRLGRWSTRTPFPWARPRHELLLLALVAVVALLPAPSANPQDISRACLGEALLHARVSNDECLEENYDYAVHGGHLYSDKAPGLSVLELPVIAVLRPLPFGFGSSARLWTMRVLTVGLALLACAFLVGRVAEGIAPGYGAITLVTFALGTIFGSLVQVSFEHVPAGLAVFGAFLLAWRRRPFLAGLAGGAALLVEYQSGMLVAVVGLYVALAGLRPLGRFVLGFLPGAVLLAAYDWAAFGAPWRLSYRYVAPQFQADQGSGFFGIGVPSANGVFAVFAGNGGLLFVSPVLMLAGYGLWLLGRRYPAEAVVAGAIVVLMLLVNVGYYLPYGGTSPGPRFFASALPFLALGLPEAFRRLPRLTLALAALSIVTVTAVNLTWPSAEFVMRNTVWGELARVLTEGESSRYVRAIGPTILHSLGAGRNLAAAVMVGAAVAAFLLAALAMPQAARRGVVSRRALAAVAAGVAVLALVDAGAVFSYPYGNGFQPRRTPALVRVSGTPGASYPGGMVNYRVDVTNESQNVFLTGIVLELDFAPGMHLVGPPKLERGNGCSGEGVVRCFIDNLSPGQPTSVWFGVQFSDPGLKTVRASVSSNGFDGGSAWFDVPVRA